MEQLILTIYQFTCDEIVYKRDSTTAPLILVTVSRRSFYLDSKYAH